MQYVCEQISQKTVQTDQGLTIINICTEWATYRHPLAITQTEMVQIGGALIGIAGLFLAYAIIARAMKSL